MTKRIKKAQRRFEKREEEISKHLVHFRYLKELKTLKFCSQCGREIPEESEAHHCPYCGGTLTAICQVRECKK